MKQHSLWISAGEMSGDLHGAHLLTSLRQHAPDLRFIGMGGPYMAQEEAFTPLFRIEELSVMGVTEVLRHLPHILGLLSRIKKSLAANRPDVR